MTVVVDTSAVLAALWGEPGGTRVDQELPGASISAVNLAELVAKLMDRGGTTDQVDGVLASLALSVHAFDEASARHCGALRSNTRHLGLSLADRACVALGLDLSLPILTADRVWSGLDLAIEIEQIR